MNILRSITKGSKRSRTSGEPSGSPSGRSSSSHHSAHSHHTASSRHTHTDELEMEEDAPHIEQPVGDTLGIIFTTGNQVETFIRLRPKSIYNTKFYSKPDMQNLGVHVGVHALFRNIRWEGFLLWNEVGYRRPTLEFLSSANLQGNTMYFRAYNNDYSITADELCTLANAPTRNTRPPSGRQNPHLNLAEFWQSITGSNNFVPGKLKTSLILHPVMRVAARLLICTFSGSEEAGSINTLELSLLYEMVHEPDVLPNFGQFLLSALNKFPRSSVHSSGIITKILRSKGIHIPSREPELTSERYLGLSNFLTGQLLREDTRNKTIVWTTGRNKDDYLALKKRDHKLLKLATPIAATNWRLPSNLTSPTQTIGEASGSGARQGEGTSAPPPSAARHSDASFFRGNYESLHSDYQGLHSSFQGLETNYQGLRDDYSALYGSFSAMQSDYAGLRQDVSQIQQDVSGIRESLSARRSVDDDMHRMIESIFSWNLGGSSDQPPPQ